MSDAVFDGTRISVSTDGKFHLELPSSDSDRNMIEGEIAVLAMFLRITQDDQWGSDLMDWFYTTHGDRLEVVPDDVEGAAV